MPECNICPRGCGADRSLGKLGFCRAPEDFLVAKTMIHKWEEPCIAGERGAGTIFFSGCNLRCVFCQNIDISRGAKGKLMIDTELTSEIVAFDISTTMFRLPTLHLSAYELHSMTWNRPSCGMALLNSWA